MLVFLVILLALSLVGAAAIDLRDRKRRATRARFQGRTDLHGGSLDAHQRPMQLPGYDGSTGGYGG